jgi:SPP1 gp7 family putative phage head morphogenesis protein
MIRRKSLAAVLSQGAPVLSLQKRTTRSLSKVQLRALAPRTPRLLEQKYLKLVRVYSDAVEQLVRELVLPLAEARDSRVRTDASEFDDVFSELNKRLLGLNLDGRLRDIGNGVVQHAGKEISRVLAIDLRSDAPFEQQVQGWVRENANLIRSVSFEQLERMRKIVSEHHATGEAHLSLRNKLMDTFGLSRSRASLIARDQTLKLNADITRARQQEVGVTEYTWVTANDERVRDAHADLDGKVIRWDDPPVVDPRTGRREHAGRDFQCRCVAVPVVDRLLGR